LKRSGPYLWLSILVCAGYFVVFIFPNHAASENIKMVAVFEPDEAVPLPYVFDMLEPADTLKQALINFAFYEYYFYGFPYFAVSALSLTPLIPFDALGDIPLVMVILRQVVSVLPMLAAILLLVYMQTKFSSSRSIVLLLLLLSVPAVVQNNFWWHPDSLAILFAMLVIFFLQRDRLDFGINFYLAAVFCGFSAGTKGIGFYFFLAIFVYLSFGYFSRKIAPTRLVMAGLGFILCMGAAYLLANPILVYRGVRNDYFRVMREQSVLLSSGYEILYAKGLSAALPTLKEYYGSVPSLILALSACVIGIVNEKTRLLNVIILAWALPISVQVFWITHFKFQYWLPVALPLFSTMAAHLPDRIHVPIALQSIRSQKGFWFFVQAFIALAVMIQMAVFVSSDISRYVERLHRADENASIQFHGLARQALEPLDDESVFVYHDVRMYVPSTPRWKTEAVFHLLDYDYISSRKFDVLMLMQQRLYDYLNPNAQGVDPEKLAQSRVFYRDAHEGTIEGYRLVFRNDFGLVYVKDDLFRQYFDGK
jgi:hypothetical protein